VYAESEKDSLVAFTMFSKLALRFDSVEAGSSTTSIERSDEFIEMTSLLSSSEEEPICLAGDL